MTVIEPIGPCAAAATEATGHRGALSLAANFIKATEVSHSVFNKAGDAICKWLTQNLRFPRMLTNFPGLASIASNATIDEVAKADGEKR